MSKQREGDIYDYGVWFAAAGIVQSILYWRDELEPIIGRLDRIEIRYGFDDDFSEAVEAGGEDEQ